MLRKSDSGTVRARGGGGATAVRDGPGDERRRRMFWGNFLSKLKRGFFPRAPRVFAVFFFLVYRNYFSLF